MAQVAQSLGELTEAFLLSKRVSGCTEATLYGYRFWLTRFQQQVGETAEAVSVRRFFARLRDSGLAPASLHKAYRVVKTFLRWCVETGSMPDEPLKGFSVRVPKALPQVPTEEEVRAILRQCPSSGFIGKRNRALVLVLADAGLRASEVLRLLVEDWNPSERSLFVRSGKGRKDRVCFLSPTTVRAIRDYLSTRPNVSREDFLFADARNRPLKKRHLLQTLHRLSLRAGLSPQRKIHPHALRHFAATSWLRNGVGLDEVRRLLGHESLSTTLRYSALVSSDLQAAHKKAGAIERMGIG